jgi:hypothetical protein
MTPVATLASLILLAQMMSINAVITKPDATFGKQCPAGMLLDIIFICLTYIPMSLDLYLLPMHRVTLIYQAGHV